MISSLASKCQDFKVEMPFFQPLYVMKLKTIIPALQNIGILHHKKAELRILLQQSVRLAILLLKKPKLANVQINYF